MKMVKCFKGHRYNAEKFSSCPHCANLEAKDQMVEPLGEEQDEVDTEEPVTIKQQKYEIIGRRKVVGCLLCVEGMMKGEGFFLVEGHNDIGRGANLEVVLSKEITVSRQAHACITYNKGQNQYFLAAAEEKTDVMYNEEIVSGPVRIESNGRIQIGQCSLRFIAFCDEDFIWDDHL